MDVHELTELRQEYTYTGLSAADLAADPIEQFRAWFRAWHEVAVGDPNAMVVATATPDGQPSVRTVLLRAVDGDGFVFYTNRDSRKGRELAANPRAALLFPWHALGRQVIVEGPAVPVDDATSDAYWSTRPRGSQLAALASPQSRPVPDRADLDRRWAALEAAHEGRDVPRPADWGGIRVTAERVEFWQGRERRLHDRLVYGRDRSFATGWRIERLAP
ncbi:MAG TPA: pyridoxamine 5'-phosphate oxidase [Acidimicrobiales bacterium]|nr:pyridoxamine 5'-phosphate oxidase [Acidimicrobiales bacterium]